MVTFPSSLPETWGNFSLLFTLRTWSPSNLSHITLFHFLHCIYYSLESSCTCICGCIKSVLHLNISFKRTESYLFYCHILSTQNNTWYIICTQNTSWKGSWKSDFLIPWDWVQWLRYYLDISIYIFIFFFFLFFFVFSFLYFFPSPGIRSKLQFQPKLQLQKHGIL